MIREITPIAYKVGTIFLRILIDLALSSELVCSRETFESKMTPDITQTFVTTMYQLELYMPKAVTQRRIVIRTMLVVFPLRIFILQ